MNLPSLRTLCDELGPLTAVLDDPELDLWSIKGKEGVICDLIHKKYADLFTHFEILVAIAEKAEDLAEDLAEAAYDMARKSVSKNDEIAKHGALSDACASMFAVLEELK